jgi:hypothetical protein
MPRRLAAAPGSALIILIGPFAAQVQRMVRRYALVAIEECRASKDHLCEWSGQDEPLLMSISVRKTLPRAPCARVPGHTDCPPVLRATAYSGVSAKYVWTSNAAVESRVAEWRLGICMVHPLTLLRFH